MSKKKTETINLRGTEYAKVVTRLAEFRESNPRGVVRTEPQIQEDGRVLFKAFVKKDKKVVHSAEATGHAFGLAKQDKDFEKLETVAVGRALALLGYAASGEIASAEEMLEFEKWQEEQHQKKVIDGKDKLENSDTLADLKRIWSELDGSVRTDLVKIKDNRKKALQAKEAVEGNIGKENEDEND